MAPKLSYNYAGIDLDTGRCHSCMTFSYEINDPAWILVPKILDDYLNKYYKDGKWYEDTKFSIPWTPPV